MDGFTWVDGIAVLILLVSVGLAYSRGLARESLSIGGWILAAVVSYQFAPTATPLVKEIPLLSDLIGAIVRIINDGGVCPRFHRHADSVCVFRAVDFHLCAEIIVKQSRSDLGVVVRRGTRVFADSGGFGVV